MVVLLLFAGMCYQLGYNAGITKGDRQMRQRQVWEATEAAATIDLDTAGQQPVSDFAEIDDGEATPPVRGIVLAPPVVLGGACRPCEPVAQAHPSSHPFVAAAAPAIAPKS